MKSYFLDTTTGEQGPLTEEQVAQMFANGTANRDTPCKVAGGTDWKTIDDFMPMLKYGTQLPNPTSQTVLRSENPPAYSSSTPTTPKAPPLPADARVKIVDVDVPFSSVFMLVLKAMISATIIGVCLFFLYLLVALLFLGGLLTHFRQ